jgi:hypothetical protein
LVLLDLALNVDPDGSQQSDRNQRKRKPFQRLFHRRLLLVVIRFQKFLAEG